MEDEVRDPGQRRRRPAQVPAESVERDELVVRERPCERVAELAARPRDQDTASRGERIGSGRAPQVRDPRIVPRDAVLVRVGGVVLLGDVVAEEEVAERLEAVGVVSGDVDRDGIGLADVLAERRPGLAVEHDDAGGAAQGDEEVVLAALVEVQSADHARARERDVRLRHPLRERAVATKLAEPAALVLDDGERDPLDAWDAHPLAPVSSTRRPISARCCQCLPASSHQPSTRTTSSLPSSA